MRMKSISQLIMLFLLFTAGVLGQNVQYVGSKSSNKYHKASCRFAQRISPGNLVIFKNADEAVAAGYVACKTCKPPNGNNTSIVPRKSSNKIERSSANSVDDGRCQAITKKGTRCKRKAMEGSKYCWQHSH